MSQELKRDPVIAHPGTVLIVDDEVHMREVIAAALAPLAVRVLIASSAEAALETAVASGETRAIAALEALRSHKADGVA